jgi:hypothetical protein
MALLRCQGHVIFLGGGSWQWGMRGEPGHAELPDMG